MQAAMTWERHLFVQLPFALASTLSGLTIQSEPESDAVASPGMVRSGKTGMASHDPHQQPAARFVAHHS